MDKKQIQVLLLEDEAAHAEAIRRALESANGDLKLHIVGSLKGFRDYIAADTPDIALVDMVLPDGNGIDLLTYPPEIKGFSDVDSNQSRQRKGGRRCFESRRAGLRGQITGNFRGNVPYFNP